MDVKFSTAGGDRYSFAVFGLDLHLAVEGGLFAGAVASDCELHGTGADYFCIVGVTEEKTELGDNFFLLRHLAICQKRTAQVTYPWIMDEGTACLCSRREFSCCYVFQTFNDGLH